MSMKTEKNFWYLIEKIQSGYKMNALECAYLLSFPENSLESAITRGVADVMSREKFGNKRMEIYGKRQEGVAYRAKTLRDEV